MRKKKYTRGNVDCTPHEKKFECVCVWCGIKFKSSRADSRTCCPKHRNALYRFVKKNGSEPDDPQAQRASGTRYRRNRFLYRV